MGAVRFKQIAIDMGERYGCAHTVHLTSKTCPTQIARQPIEARQTVTSLSTALLEGNRSLGHSKRYACDDSNERFSVFTLCANSPCEGPAVCLQVLVSNKSTVARPTSRECAAKRLLVSASDKTAGRCTRAGYCTAKGLLVSVSNEAALTCTTPVLRSTHRLQVCVTNKSASAMP